ncbi:MAG: hydroxyectoine utilization dehydratase EutB, partial [Alphaproteobacteria bacterium HGW-Alphaproteobacteria-2]
MGVTLADILAARRVIRGAADATPFVPSPFMSARAGQEFLLKLENMQPIGAFKLRGALNAVMSLPAGVEGVTCCSTGNHGRGVAWAARARGLRAVICMSSLVPQTKVEGIRALGAEVRIVGTTQ